MTSERDLESPGPLDDFAYATERDMALDHDHCFLCGLALSENTRTVEHVFPQWLLADFDLHNQKINLLNGSSIRYRSLVIPCCKDCNTFWLARRGLGLTPAVSGVSASAMCSFRLGYGKTGRCRRRPGAATTDSSADAS